jgi:hypothetical protein
MRSTSREISFGKENRSIDSLFVFIAQSSIAAGKRGAEDSFWNRTLLPEAIFQFGRIL